MLRMAGRSIFLKFYQIYGKEQRTVSGTVNGVLNFGIVKIETKLGTWKIEKCCVNGNNKKYSLKRCWWTSINCPSE